MASSSKAAIDGPTGAVVGSAAAGCKPPSHSASLSEKEGRFADASAGVAANSARAWESGTAVLTATRKPTVASTPPDGVAAGGSATAVPECDEGR